MFRIGKKYHRAIMTMLSLVGALFGCTPMPDVTMVYQQLPRSEWSKDIPLQFTVFVPEAHCPYRIGLSIRHNNLYDYNTLRLRAQLTNHRGYSRVDTLELPLSKMAGRWEGSGITYKELGFTYLSGEKFPLSGLYTLSLTPIASLPHLRGIENVGISYQPTNTTHRSSTLSLFFFKKSAQK